MSQPFTTRAESAAPPAYLVETMARAAYEATRPPGSARPRWESCSPEWQDAARREMSAGLMAAETAGLITIARGTTP